MTAVMLQHDKTGAQHMHAAREDDNNAFSVMFRTTPMDSTGVPHILEHTVLCGSEKYPVHDPFFKMLSRSLATFMNALTAYDWTMYPFSTQNPQDFRNLLSVYMDAAFRPLLRELDFCQEGWRLEPEDPQNTDSPLTLKGVVYNEMKGVFSSSQSLFATAALNQLMPSHTYGVISGGDPKCIPDLTWAQLKDFHASHYHPSNSRFFTYGNFPLENHLEYIGNYLNGFDKISIDTTVPKEQRWKKPRQYSITCPPDPMAPDPRKQTTVAVAYLLSDITDTYEKFVQQIVCHLLTDGETAPFYSSLLAANIGSDYAPITGFNDSTKESSYAVGLQGIKKSDVKKVTKIIDHTLQQVIKEGFDPARIEALLHRIELGQKHQTSNFGFDMSIGLSSHWNHDGDPVELIQVNKQVERFRKDLADNPQFLQQKVQQYFKDNVHRLTLTMSPDAKYLARQTAQEKERLAKKVASLSEKDRQKIIARGQTLLQKQMMEEDLSCLPSLKVADIDPCIKPEIVETSTLAGVRVQYSKQPTNGVTYMRLVASLPDLPKDVLSLVPLFCNIITSIGAGGHDYRWMSQQQELYTGGMAASTQVSSHHSNPKYLQQGVVFSSNCLERNLGKMLELWGLIFSSPDFSDRDRLTTLIGQSASDLASSVPQAGHHYAMSYAASSLSPAAALTELFGGMSQVSLMKKIAETSDLSEVVLKLEEIASLVLNKDNLRVSVNATPESMSDALKQVESFISTLPGEPEGKPIFSAGKAMERSPGCTQFELPFSVNYMSQSVPTVPYTHPDRPVLTVLGTLLSRMYLHREIREKGGAYGSGASTGDGVFTFFSYRDPHSTQTLKAFEDSVQWVTSGQFTNEELDQAKISVFQATDKPVTPGNQGMRLFMDDVTDEQRQAYRDLLFAVNRDSIISVAKMYLGDSSRPRGTCCLGPANSAFQGDSQWSVIREQ
ncbi:presequence protease, mitochondrial-like isoform X2 [Babylonia areolata]